MRKAELDKESNANYRPISILKFLGEVLECIVLSQLQQHLDSEQALNPFQSAYRRHHSIESVLLKITNIIMAERTTNVRLTLLVLLDFSAAFDTIEHSMLIERLRRAFNISFDALEWFNSYVSNREQLVLIGASTISLRPTHRCSLSSMLQQHQTLGTYPSLLDSQVCRCAWGCHCG